MTDMAAVAARALPLLDLTNLDDHCSESAIGALCKRAVTPHGAVAAVCVWPRFVGECQRLLAGKGVRIASVVNFPHGGPDVERAMLDARETLRDGADEIDLVMPWRDFLAGDEGLAREMIRAVKDEAGTRTLKVILETGELGTPEHITAASRLALKAGADFIKTSTGKVKVSATPDAARLMLEAIRDAGGKQGFKAAGGIRTVADAAIYLTLADEILGPSYISPSRFRFGASGLLDALLASIEGHEAIARDTY